MTKTRKTDVDDFLVQEKLAVVGASRSRNKFGNTVFRELKKKGYRVFPVNNQAETLEGEPCYPDLKSLPEPVGGVIVVVPSQRTPQVVKEAKEAGITRVWLQYGANSKEAVQFCLDNNMTVVANECILMFIEPVNSVHKFHRWLWKLFGKYPR
jgi:hypothetical protein